METRRCEGTPCQTLGEWDKHILIGLFCFKVKIWLFTLINIFPKLAMPSKWLEKAASPKGANICGRKQRNPSKMCVSKICQKCASKKLRQKYARSIKLQRHPDSLRWRSNSLMIWFSVKPKEWSLEKGWHPPSSANSVIILAAIWEELFVLELIRYHVSKESSYHFYGKCCSELPQSYLVHAP